MENETLQKEQPKSTRSRVRKMWNITQCTLPSPSRSRERDLEGSICRPSPKKHEKESFYHEEA